MRKVQFKACSQHGKQSGILNGSMSQVIEKKLESYVLVTVVIVWYMCLSIFLCYTQHMSCLDINECMWVSMQTGQRSIESL